MDPLTPSSWEGVFHTFKPPGKQPPPPNKILDMPLLTTKAVFCINLGYSLLIVTEVKFFVRTFEALWRGKGIFEGMKKLVEVLHGALFTLLL